jgi:thiol-disulfide isomerase/thioredoxin
MGRFYFGRGRARAVAVTVLAVATGCGMPNDGMKKPRVPSKKKMLSALAEAAGTDGVAASGLEVSAKERRFLGEWRAVLRSPGGGLPFGLVIEPHPEREGLAAFMANGNELVPFSNVTVEEREITLEVEGYDSRITAQLGGETLKGEWTKTVPEGESTMRFSAAPGPSPRFLPADKPPVEGAPDSVAGDWSIVFTEEDGTTYPGRGEWTLGERTTVLGTILTDTGDYRYLEGRYDAGYLRMSVFDGAHAFLFSAAWSDGALRGDFWSRESYHATFVATPLAEGDADGLPDPWSVVESTSRDGQLHFSFPDHSDMSGAPVTDADPRFDGKVVIVDLFGSWCPNCNDQAALLSRWHERWAPKGLAVVGLAFEMTGDAERDAEMVKRYADRHGVSYPLLVAGTSDKQEAGTRLPGLSKVASYPTTIFIGRDKKVRKIYSGFAGPATGDHHAVMVKDSEALIESLLAEPPS